VAIGGDREELVGEAHPDHRADQGVRRRVRQAEGPGAEAYSVVTLLPVELVLQVGSGAGYAMIFALLIAAIVWNPEETITPRKLNRPDHTTATAGGRLWV
jgi:hypothetical protein